MNVQNLTAAISGAVVKVNGQDVGQIHPYNPTDSTPGNHSNYWYTQMINIEINVLNSGSNTLEIQPVTRPGAALANAFDNFFVKDVVCFFQ